MRWLCLVLVACSARSKPVSPPPIAERSPVAPRTPEPDPAPPTFRLPGDVTPIRIALDLTIVPAVDRVTGTVRFAATVVRPTRVVWLNAAGLVVSHAELAGKAARVIKGGDDFIGLASESELGVGPLAIGVAFEASLDRTRSRGIYAETEGTEPYVYTFFEPIDARRAFPCFDEPAYKVPWQLTFHVKRDHVALANAPVVRETDEPGGMKRVELAESKPMPSYLVAFVVGPFEVIDGGVAGRAHTPIRFIVPSGRAGELGWAKQVTPRVVAALEDYFDMDYPYGKLDVAVVPRYWGTMEHPGIVAMGQPLTLIRGDQETRARKQGYANILAHELSHYWFGDYVTMAWWNDTWLNEALGEWSDMNITEAVEPTWRVRDDRVGLALQAMTADETLATRAMRNPVTTREGIQASFDNDITYFKGASLLRMFEAIAGRDAWRDFVRGYVRAHAWGNASETDFTSAMRAALGPQVADGFDSFLGVPGVPLVTAEIRCDQRVVVASHRRSLPPNVADPNHHAWKLPVCVRYGDATRANRACGFGEASVRIPIEGRCPTWIIPNADAVGYYRSSIDPKVARDLLDPRSAIARVAKPTSAERMMLVADLRAMVQRDELAIDRLLALVPAIAADPDPKVARWAFEAASFATDELDDALHAAATKWRVRAFGPSARALGWRRAQSDSDERHSLRIRQLAEVARDDDAIARAGEKLADRWIEDRTGLDDDLVGVALGVAMYRGTSVRFDRYLAAARAARDRTERTRILGALGFVRDPGLAARVLELALGKEFDLRDTMWIAGSLLFHRATRDRALVWFEQHLDELLARMRDDDAAGYLGALAGAFCNPRQRKAVADLVTPRAAKIDGAQAAVARSLEQSEQCIVELARERSALTRFLRRN